MTVTAAVFDTASAVLAFLAALTAASAAPQPPLLL